MPKQRILPAFSLFLSNGFFKIEISFDLRTRKIRGNVLNP